jgi:hypothetical protein
MARLGEAFQPTKNERIARRTRDRISRRILPYGTFYPTSTKCDFYH